jgi:translation initiation factor 2-alpha kinase 4
MKARHRLDHRVYAIKKLRMDALEFADDEQLHDHSKVLREVSTLSRLTHPNIVRYQQAWIERAEDETDNDDDSSAIDGIDDDEAMYDLL